MQKASTAVLFAKILSGMAFRRTKKAPLCKGSCHIADFRQYD